MHLGTSPFEIFNQFGGSVYDRHCLQGLVSWTPAPDVDARQMERGGYQHVPCDIPEG